MIIFPTYDEQMSNKVGVEHQPDKHPSLEVYIPCKSCEVCQAIPGISRYGVE